jgi:hypothetical protein
MSGALTWRGRDEKPDRMRRSDLLRYPVTALAAAIYWMLAAWTCFAASGVDPLDAITGPATAGQRLVVVAILAVFVIAAAWLGRRWSRRTST